MRHFKLEIADYLANAIGESDRLAIQESIEIPKNPAMGDFAYPCFKLAKTFKKAPQAIAEELLSKLASNELVQKVTAVSGYLNITLDPKVYAESVVDAAINEADAFGQSTIGEKKTVLVEFSSTNIAKPFHIGHIRSTMIGNSLYRIYKALGYDAIAINHLGDYGTQFGKLIVAYKLWGVKEDIENDPIPELLKIYVRFHEEAESNPALDDEARLWFKRLEENDEEAHSLWTWFREVSLKEFNRVYGMLGVHFDSFAGESFYSDKMPAVLDEMRSKKIMQASEGAEIVDLEPFGMPPALITKKDGSTLYITRDIAAAIYRKNHYNFHQNIYVVGSQQKLHFQQWMKIIEMMGHEWAKDCHHIEFGTVSLEEGSMSTRRGRVVFLEDVLKSAVDQTLSIINEKNPNLENKEEVAQKIGVGAVVFQELHHNRIKDYVFSLEKTLSFEGETGPYVQYTHARACSVLRNYKGAFDQVDYSRLTDDAAQAVVRSIGKFPDLIQDAAKKYEPSLITRYVVDLAQEFNRFYHDHQILVEDAETSKARVALVKATVQTIKNALYLIGLEAPVRM